MKMVLCTYMDGVNARILKTNVHSGLTIPNKISYIVIGLLIISSDIKTATKSGKKRKKEIHLFVHHK